MCVIESVPFPAVFVPYQIGRVAAAATSLWDLVSPPHTHSLSLSLSLSLTVVSVYTVGSV